MAREKGSKWKEGELESEIKSVMNALSIDRMPTHSEFIMLGRSDISDKISKTGRIMEYARTLGLKMKSEVEGHSSDSIGKRYEEIVEEKLESLGYSVIRMTNSHPYDLLINGSLKIDVKVANPYTPKKGNACHMMNLGKKYDTCDVYICVLLNDKKEIDRELIIPSQYLNVKLLQVGKESKYNYYDKKYEIIDDMLKFNESIFNKYHYRDYEKKLKVEGVGLRRRLEIEEVKEVIDFLKNNVLVTDIAKKYYVSEASISDIKNNKTWKHVQRN